MQKHSPAVIFYLFPFFFVEIRQWTCKGDVRQTEEDVSLPLTWDHPPVSLSRSTSLTPLLPSFLHSFIQTPALVVVERKLLPPRGIWYHNYIGSRAVCHCLSVVAALERGCRLGHTCNVQWATGHNMDTELSFWHSLEGKIISLIFKE